MKISIFGMGYVGCVTAACLAHMGNKIFCVEVVDEKIQSIRQGKWPIYEPGLDQISEKDQNNCFINISVSSDNERGISETDISLVCVGTPNFPDGRVDLSFLKRTIVEIATAIKKFNKKHIIVIRSTIPPGTTEGPIASILNDFGIVNRCHLAVYPEFMREGSAVHDFFEPSLNVVGCNKDFSVNIIKNAFPSIQKKLLVTSIKTAETIKYANNAFHALKIAFTNEFSLFCKAYGVNSEEVMDLFCQDKVLNLSPYYLRPGFAFGGSCLPKELKGLIALSQEKRVETPLFGATLYSNKQLVRRLLTLIFDHQVTKIGFYGVTFKPGTDDIRESPVLKVIEKLLSNTPTYRKKFGLQIFDVSEVLAKIKNLYNNQIHTSENEEDLINNTELFVLGPFKIREKTEKAIIDSGKPVIDLKWHRVSNRLQQYEKYHSLV